MNNHDASQPRLGGTVSNETNGATLLAGLLLAALALGLAVTGSPAPLVVLLGAVSLVSIALGGIPTAAPHAPTDSAVVAESSEAVPAAARLTAAQPMRVPNARQHTGWSAEPVPHAAAERTNTGHAA
jgi:hypothetical protein